MAFPFNTLLNIINEMETTASQRAIKNAHLGELPRANGENINTPRKQIS